MTDSRVGQRFGKYEIRRLLGEGGMGEVYEAFDVDKRRLVALKILPSHLSRDVTYRKRFQRESHVAGRLQDPHVIPIHDWGDVDGTLYIDMQLIRGTDLHKLLGNGPLEPTRAVSIVSQIAAALDAAHADGLIHRDVKPENILVTPTDFAYLVDFGIAEDSAETHLTSVGSAIGSFAYMAPERFGDAPITPAADVYSLGCVFHESLTGAKPFPGTSTHQLIAGHLSAGPPRPSHVNPRVPPIFDDIVVRALSKDPRQRYQSAGEFARAAQQALRTPPGPPASVTRTARHGFTPAPPPPPPPPPQPHILSRTVGPDRGSKRALPAVIALAAVLVLGGLALAIFFIAKQGGGSGRDAGGTTSAASSATTTSGRKTTPTSRGTTTTTAAPLVLPPGAKPCPPTTGPSGGFTTSATGTSVTSCEFAEEVRRVYGGSGPPSPTPRRISVYSTVTNQPYDMTCSANGPLVTCSGGNDAVVYVY